MQDEQIQTETPAAQNVELPTLIVNSNNPSDARTIFEAGGIAALLEQYDNADTLEVVGYENVTIPENISKFSELTGLVVVNAANVPQSLKDCKKLELLALTNSPATTDISFLNDLPELQVLNVKDSAFQGVDTIDQDRILVITE